MFDNKRNGDMIFSDHHLESEIRKALQLQNDPLTTADLKTIRHLSLNNQKISSLNGLEGATNLSTLSISHHNLSTLDPLLTLDHLRHLSIRLNKSITPKSLSSLTKLTDLQLKSVGEQDIEPLGGLLELRRLALGSIVIRNIQSIATLPNLKVFDLNRPTFPKKGHIELPQNN